GTLSSDTIGSGYTLTATAASLTPATSSPFNITQNPASQLGFTTQPGGGIVGTPLSTQPVVKAQDSFGTYTAIGLPSSLVLTMSVLSGGGTLLGTTTADIGTSAGNGIATF